MAFTLEITDRLEFTEEDTLGITLMCPGGDKESIDIRIIQPETITDRGLYLTVDQWKKLAGQVSKMIVEMYRKAELLNKE